jgi:hypothetical protein
VVEGKFLETFKAMNNELLALEPKASFKAVLLLQKYCNSERVLL